VEEAEQTTRSALSTLRNDHSGRCPRSFSYFCTTHRNHRSSRLGFSEARARSLSTRQTRRNAKRRRTRETASAGITRYWVHLIPPDRFTGIGTVRGCRAIARSRNARSPATPRQSVTRIEYDTAYCRGTLLRITARIMRDDHSRPSSAARTNVSDTLSAVCHLE